MFAIGSSNVTFGLIGGMFQNPEKDCLFCFGITGLMSLVLFFCPLYFTQPDLFEFPESDAGIILVKSKSYLSLSFSYPFRSHLINQII